MNKKKTSREFTQSYSWMQLLMAEYNPPCEYYIHSTERNGDVKIVTHSSWILKLERNLKTENLLAF